MKLFNRLFTLFCLVGATSLLVQAQQHPEKCGFNHAVEYLNQKNPYYKQQINDAYQQWVIEANAKQNKNDKSIYVVPVVFHVVWNSNNPQENLDDSVLIEQINVLNEDFRRLNADTVNMRSGFAPVVGDAQIEFQLACKDTNGNATDGIVRVQTSTTFGGGFLPDMASIAKIQNTSQGGSDAWNTSEYLNIWVGDINGGSATPSLLGVATPPAGLSNWPANSIPPELTDGAIIHYSAFGRNNPVAMTATVINGRTVTHEVGHYLGVRHTAENTFGGLFGSICGDDDGLTDTPNCDQSQQGCNATRNSCTDAIPGVGDLPDMVENYMDYSDQDCQNSFTNGQIGIMRSVLQNERNGLLTSPALSNCVVGIEENMLANNVSIYPNPSNGIVTVTTNNEEKITVIFFNSMGQSVQPTLIGNQQYQLDNKGIYFVTVQTEKTTITKKVVVQ
ncbi:MAG: zinc-dependent metalloprotease [Flavobacteriales bacterium]|nr:zinc-dependent metalloprotease [Flavobacteriales bacterium]